MAAGFEHMLRRSWITVPGETIMKRIAFPHRKLPELPIAWLEAEYVPRADAADRSGVSEDFFDVEDERAEVDIIVHRMILGAH
jgi:hypothetical protein